MRERFKTFLKWGTEPERLERETIKLATVVETSQDFIATADLDGRLTYMNAAGRELIGIDAGADVSLLRFTDYVAETWLAFFRDTVLETVDRTGIWSGEMQLRNLKTGRIIDVHRTTFRITDPESGLPWAYASVTRDISEAKRQAAELRAKDEAFQALADAMPQLVWMADASGIVTYYNARLRDYFGASRRADGTFDWQPLVHPDDLEATAQAWAAATRSNAPFSYEQRLRMADGSYRWHLSRAVSVTERGGKVWYGTATDIHALKEGQLARDQMLALVSHDMKTPITVLQVQADLFRNKLGGGDGPARAQVEGFLAVVEQQVRRLEGLLDEALDVARLHAGWPLSLQREAVDLVETARLLVEQHRSATRRHSFALWCTAESMVCHADRRRIARALDNLLSNAVKYSPSGGTIAVEIEAAGDPPAAFAVVRVRDEGIGIPRRDLAAIFEWYARGDNVAASPIRGAGIGLAGAKQIVEQHGGTIGAESVEGRGAMFTIRLPLGQPEI